MVVGALTVPFMIRELGVERFGILTMLWSIVGYASLFDFGLGRAATQQISSRLAKDDTAVIDSIARSAIVLTAAIGVVVACTMAVFAGPLARNFLNVSPGLVSEVRNALIIVAIGVPMATVSNGLRGVAEGYRAFAQVNIARILVGTGLFLFPLCAVAVSAGGLVTVAVALVVARLVGAGCFWSIFDKLPKHLNQRVLSFHEMRTIFATGMWMSVSSLVSPVLVNADRFVISNVLGASHVAYYTTPFEFLVRILMLPAAIGSSLLPRLTADHLVDTREGRRLFRRAVILTAGLMIVICAACAAVSFPLLSIATNVDFARKSLPVAYVLLAGIAANGVANIPYTALHSRGAAKFTGLTHILELACYMPLTLFLVGSYGLVGAAIGWTCRSVADCVVLFLGYWRLHR